MKNLSTILTLVFVSVAFISLNAFAVTIHVPDDYETIQEAIDESEDGDTVLVAPGEYVENIDFDGKDIVVASLFLINGDEDYIDETIIDGDEDGSVVTFANEESGDAILVGFTLRNGSGYEDDFFLLGGGIFCYGSAPIINHCHITECSASMGGGIYSNHSRLEVIECKISENSAVNGGGIYSGSYTQLSILDCVIYSNLSSTGGGVHSEGDRFSTLNLIRTALIMNSAESVGAGLYLQNIDPIITNCTISENIAEDNGGGIYCPRWSSPTLRNTILWSNLPQGAVIRGYNAIERITISYSDVEGGEEDIVTLDRGEIVWGEGNIDEDPLFVDPEEGNFHLTEDSPCIDAGDPDNPRDPDRSRADIGAFYYHHEVEEIPDIIVSPEALDFGPVKVDTSHTLILSIRNVGIVDLEISEISVNQECFSTNVDERVVINPDSSIELMVTFEPTEWGVFHGELIIHSNDPDEEDLLVCLEGIGLIDHDPGIVILVPDDYENIQAAIIGGIDEDTILVHPGVYTENITFMGKNLIVGSLFLTLGNYAYIDSTIIDGNEAGSVVTFNQRETQDAVLCGFTVRNGRADANLGNWDGGGIRCVNTSPILRNLVVLGCTSNRIGGGIYCGGGSPTISDVLVKDNHGASGGGIASFMGSTPTITRVVLSNNRAHFGGGACYFVWSEPALVNVTIYGNHSEENSGGIYCFGDEVIVNIINTIIHENDPVEISLHGQSTCCIYYSNINGGQAGIEIEEDSEVVWGEGNIDTDPLFVDADGSDFHLTEDSPCRDAGTAFFVWEEDTLVNLSEDEYAGEAPDMGKFEFGFEAVIHEDVFSPLDFKLFPNYPNPFNSTTTIRYGLPYPSHLSLQIYNPFGQRIGKLFEGYQHPGIHTTTLSGANLPSGLYFVRLEAAGELFTQKVMLIR